MFSILLRVDLFSDYVSRDKIIFFSLNSLDVTFYDKGWFLEAVASLRGLISVAGHVCSCGNGRPEAAVTGNHLSLAGASRPSGSVLQKGDIKTNSVVSR